MCCHRNHAFNYSQNKLSAVDIFRIPLVSLQLDTHGNLSWGSKVGQIRSHGTSNMILIAYFQQFFFIVRIFSPIKIPFPHRYFEDFFYETGRLPDKKKC